MENMTEFAPTSRDYLPAAGHDYLLPFYDVMTKLMGVTKVHRELLEHADLRDGHRVLEVGAGTGNLSVLATSAAPGITLTSTDPDPRALRRARRKSKDITFEQAFAENLPYEDASFDRVLSSLMLHHLGDDLKATALAEIRRVTAPGGALVVADLVGPHGHGFTGHASMRQAAFADDVPALLLDAGFSAAEEVGRRSSRVGTVAFWRGVR
jgi:ubiquinone/menaquinone biosynthesis C-methylase UbiE